VSLIVSVWFVIALTVAVRRNGGRWLKREPLTELRKEIESRWPGITGVGVAYKNDADCSSRTVTSGRISEVTLRSS
jgi:hypothetical protein